MNKQLLLLAASWADVILWVWQWVMLPTVGLFLIIALLVEWKQR